MSDFAQELAEKLMEAVESVLIREEFDELVDELASIIRRRLAERDVEVIHKCADKVRADCEACGGTGVAGVVSHEMALDAGERQLEGEPIECEYCGRPRRAILALLQPKEE